MKKQFMRRTACVLVLALALANGIVTCAKTKSFTRDGSTATATLTGAKRIGGAATAIIKGDYTKICFAQVVPAKADGTYMSGGKSAHQIDHISVTCTAPNNKHKKFVGVHQLKDSNYRPYGTAVTLTVDK